MQGKFLITYTIKKDNEKASHAADCFFTKYGFEKEEDQSTYLSKSEKYTLREIQDALCNIRCHIKNHQEEHITLYYAKDDKIVRG